MSHLNIRPATLAASDNELLIDFQESQIPWLSSVGGAEQWGTQSIREVRPESSDKARVWIERSERNTGQWSADWCRAFIAETKVEADESSSCTPVAGLVLDSKAAAYVGPVLAEQDENDPFVYLAYLISNREAGAARKGAGSALIEVAKEQTRQAGVKRICLDCFAGNERKLVRYYESQGFKSLAEFEVQKGEQKWPCCVLEMRLS